MLQKAPIQTCPKLASFPKTILPRIVSGEGKSEIEWAPRLQKENTLHSNHYSLTTNTIMKLKWAILHQIYAQALESLPWILPWCFSPIGSSLHHGHKLLITDATILRKQKIENCYIDLKRRCECMGDVTWEAANNCNFRWNSTPSHPTCFINYYHLSNQILWEALHYLCCNGNVTKKERTCRKEH